MRVRRRLAVLAVATAVAALGAPVPASAAESATCTLSGSGTFVPGVRAVLGPNGPIGGGGGYELSAQANCAYANTATGVNTVTPARIRSKGTFANDVCFVVTLTGELHDTTIDFADPSATDITQMDYFLYLAGETATLRGLGLINGRSGRAAGEATIRRSDGDCVTQDVTGFTIDGVLTAVIP
jgi:hypothetical protein